jgi:ABC-type lipoprotein export system ATPase subunit
MSVIVSGVTKSYGATQVLRGVDLTGQPGELIALFGASGSGKTTLLNLIGALDTPTAGSILINGVEIATLDERRRIQFRRQQIGFIFQNYTLMPTYTAAENIDLLLRLHGLGYGERRRRTAHGLEAVGLSAWADHLPAELSGGQRQRIAIARALAAQPPLILADEPTSGLDTQTARRILNLFRSLAAAHGTTFLIVSHDPALATRVDAVYDLRDGVAVKRPNSSL